MATKLKSVDVLIIGLGWTGGIIAKELASTGLKIVALERGGPRDTNSNFLEPQIHDELRYAARHDLMQNVSRETLSIANGAADAQARLFPSRERSRRCGGTLEWGYVALAGMGSPGTQADG
jgi:choline dehydrogenase-like flavoprotein